MSTPLVVLNAIAAEITKPDGKFNFKFGKLWDGANKPALNFVTEIEKKFTRKTKSYGFLNIDATATSIPTILTKFNKEPAQFIPAATSLMNRLHSSLNEEGRGNTRIGHMVFVHYRNEGEEEDLGRLLVVMVDNKDVFDFGEGMVPTQFKSIDVDTLRQAVLYDLTLFDSVYPDHVTDKQDEAYLRFITGRSKGQFFQEAFGGANMIDNTVNISSLFECIEKFGKSLALKSPHINKLKEEVEALMLKKGGKEISLAAVAKTIITNLPEKDQLTKVDDFLDFVSENEYCISEIFDVTKGQLTKATSIEGKKGQDYYYRIKKSALGTVKDNKKSIRYDQGSRILYIHVDDEQHAELIAALPDKG